MSRSVQPASLVLPLIGGAIGFFGYIGAAALIESGMTQTQPTLSYGQAAGMISLPLCTLILASTGFAVSLLVARRVQLAVALLLLVSFLGGCVTALLWLNQVANYGRDPSEYVLFWPPLVCSVVPLGIGLFVGIAGVPRPGEGDA